MTPDKQDALNRAIAKVAKQYGIINYSFCGEEKETGNFIGFLGDGPTIKIKNIWSTVINIGRLWQHARNTTRNMLNEFDKQSWK
jgi:hypothetical protein